MRNDGWPFADRALAERIEDAEAEAAVDYAQGMTRVASEIRVGSLPVGGGLAVFSGGSRASRAFALGLRGPVPDADLDAMEAFYADRDAPVIIDLCPLADSALVGALGRRGYRITGFSQIWIRPLAPGERFEAVAGVEVDVRVAGPEEAELWSRTVGQGFFGEEAVPDEEVVRGQAMFHVAYATCFLARIAGTPAGGAAMIQQRRLVSLFATSTLPRARRRGVQTALLRARLDAAAAAGCDLALVITEPGSGSARNAERLGFRLGYTKVELTRAKAEGR